MSVNHFLLPISDAELSSLLSIPESIFELIERREPDVVTVSVYGPAIGAQIAESDDDPLSFLATGGPPEVHGWIGEYKEAEGRVITCQLNMGYGPAWYCKNSFIVEVNKLLRPWAEGEFTAQCDAAFLAFLEKYDVYPGGWHSPGRKEDLIEHFGAMCRCVESAAMSGKHLLFWCA